MIIPYMVRNKQDAHTGFVSKESTPKVTAPFLSEAVFSCRKMCNIYKVLALLGNLSNSAWRSYLFKERTASVSRANWICLREDIGRMRSNMAALRSGCTLKSPGNWFGSHAKRSFQKD